jgi:hypothetical protein
MDPSQQTSPSLDPQIEKDLKKYDMKSAGYTGFSSLATQCDWEFQLSYEHQYPKKEESLARLKLYNNQKRAKDAVGDTTLFTTFQTVLAALYNDRLSAEWGAREDGDEEVAENLTQMATFDYDEMEKDLTDYDWDWDTGFFGRGILDLTEFVREPEQHIYVPVPEVWDPTLFVRDPRAVAVNGNNKTGKNAMRFAGLPVRMTKQAMQDNPNFFNDIDWGEVNYGAGTKSLLDIASAARNEAQGNQQPRLAKYSEDKLGDNAEYELLMWLTHWRVNGILKKVKVWLANERKKVVGVQILSDYKKKWGLIDRALYPTAHDWDGTSIPDLTEDKQRHRAVAQNLGLKAMTADLYPNYIYDQNKIKNRNDLQFGFNKFIPVDGSPESIIPMRKAAPNMQLAEWILNSLDVSAQKATATPDIQQGIQSEKNRPLGETNLIAGNVQTRYGLAAKVFGWSERRFWQQWYRSYKENFAASIDTKVVRLQGAFGPKWRELDRDNIVANIDPDVKVESQVLSRAKQLEERQTLGAYFGVAVADPTVNRRYAMKKLGKLNGMTKDELDRLWPPTVDEYQAEEENDLLNQGKYVRVLPEQDHHAHLEIHSKAKLTPATKVHIETHIHTLSLKRKQPELFPTAQDQNAAQANPNGSAPEQTQATVGLLGNGSASGGIQPSQTSGQTVPLQG